MVKIESRIDDTLAVIKVTGHLDFEMRELYDEVNSLLEKGIKRFILDLSNVTYGNSAGLGEIVRVYTRIARSKGIVAIAGSKTSIREQFALTKLTQIFAMFDTVGEAKAAIEANEVAMP